MSVVKQNGMQIRNSIPVCYVDIQKTVRLIRLILHHFPAALWHPDINCTADNTIENTSC